MKELPHCVFLLQRDRGAPVGNIFITTTLVKEAAMSEKLKESAEQEITTGVSRRSFIKTAAVVGAGVLAVQSVGRRDGMAAEDVKKEAKAASAAAAGGGAKNFLMCSRLLVKKCTRAVASVPNVTEWLVPERYRVWEGSTRARHSGITLRLLLHTI